MRQSRCVVKFLMHSSGLSATKLFVECGFKKLKEFCNMTCTYSMRLFCDQWLIAVCHFLTLALTNVIT